MAKSPALKTAGNIGRNEHDVNNCRIDRARVAAADRAAVLRGRGAIFAFYLLLCGVGLGYLFTTGAIDDIGTKVLELIGQATAEKGAEPAAAPAN